MTVLHASAVALDGVALAFVGQSGRGSSTVAALLCLEGAELATDDVLVVDPSPPVTCTGGAPELRLREGAAVLAESRPHGTTRVTADDRLAFALTPAPPEPLPLRRHRDPRAITRRHGRRDPTPPPERCRVLAAGVPANPRVVPTGRAQSRLRRDQPDRQHDPGLRRVGPVGTAVRPSGRPIALRAGSEGLISGRATPDSTAERGAARARPVGAQRDLLRQHHGSTTGARPLGRATAPR
jgi:hypothetical protein